jgi:hypothetical protein
MAGDCRNGVLKMNNNDWIELRNWLKKQEKFYFETNNSQLSNYYSSVIMQMERMENYKNWKSLFEAGY